MSIKLFLNACFKFLLGIVFTFFLIFVPAGTLNYFNGWLLMIVLFVPIFIAGSIMMIKNPSLLASRLDIKEKKKEQDTIIKLSGLMFIIGFVLAGLDFRFNWLILPNVVSYIAVGIFLIGYILWAIVLKQNTYLSRTIKVEKNQHIIDKGLYSVVRHPMYLASIIVFLMMPLILCSLISFFVFLIYPIIIVFRIKFEEKFLIKNLDGYIQYQKKVKYRLIPYIW